MQGFWTIEIKQTGSNTRKNANYVPKPFGLQNMWMKKLPRAADNKKQERFFKFVKKNVASGTNHKCTMIDADSLNDYFANIARS